MNTPESSETFQPLDHGDGRGATPLGGVRGGAGGGGRTMADIAKLFMSGADVAPAGGANANGGGVPRPTRVPPKSGGGASSAVSVPVGRRTIPLPGAPAGGVNFALKTKAGRLPEESSGSALPVVQLALTDGGGAGNFAAIVEVAKLLAGQHRTAMGVVARDGGVLRVARVEGVGRPVFMKTTFAAPQVGADVQLARTLCEMKETVEHWIVALPGAEAETVARGLLRSCGEWLISCATDNDALIACYRTVKSVCGLVRGGGGERQEGRRIGLFVQTTDRAEAVRVHTRLNHVALGFLDQELSLLALTHPAAAIVQLQGDFGLTRETSEAIWLSVLDFVGELVGGSDEECEGGFEGETLEDEGENELGANPEEDEEEIATRERSFAEVADVQEVLDHEERVALTEGFGGGSAGARGGEDEGVAAEVASGLREPEVAKVASRVGQQAAASPGEFGAIMAGQGAGMKKMGLRAVEALPLAAGRAMVWEAVQQSIPDLVPGTILLEAKPPHDDCSLLMADTQGRLHLWVLSDGANGMGWCGLWRWALDHRQLIGLTRRDLRIDVGAEVRVHVVLPPGEAGGVGGSGPVGVNWYRMWPVQWRDRTGLVVVPLG